MFFFYKIAANQIQILLYSNSSGYNKFYCSLLDVQHVHGKLFEKLLEIFKSFFFFQNNPCLVKRYSYQQKWFKLVLTSNLCVS